MVEKYRDAHAWNALSDLDIKALHDHIAPLMMETDQDELAKRFDALMLDLQLSVLNGEQTLNAPQIRFMDTIINFLNIRGIIEPSMLFEAPFTDINSNGVAGVFEAQIASKIISLIETINHNAEAA